jgi:GWxTD domain-containing protein
VDSGAEGAIKHRLDIEDFGGAGFSMSDPRFGSCGAGDEGLGVSASEAALVRGRFGGERLPDVCVRGEIYDGEAGRRGGPSEYLLRWRIRDERGSERAGDTLRVAGGEGRIRFEFRPRLQALSMGRYEIRIEAHRGADKVERCLAFEMDETRLSVLEDPADLLELLGFFATEEEVREWEQAGPAARGALWDEFWRRRDPSPGTPENEAKAEFFDRVRHANANFGSPGSPGWKSDRGMVYIRHGAPDYVESHPMNATDPPYEVWHYYGLGLRFIFADLGGFGHYVLVRE